MESSEKSSHWNQTGPARPIPFSTPQDDGGSAEEEEDDQARDEHLHGEERQACDHP